MAAAGMGVEAPASLFGMGVEEPCCGASSAVQWTEREGRGPHGEWGKGSDGLGKGSRVGGASA
jgi:hypothetical protein